jgi:hemerythrin-like domain-containing protein
MARQLELTELVSVLSKEHQEQRKRLADLIDALEKKAFDRGARLASEFDNSSIQHIVDEENVLLKLFIDTYGRKGADDAIRVFQQHRTMHRLADSISRTAIASPTELGSIPSDFDKLVRSHFEAEEKRIFPWALKAHETIRKQASRTSTKN